MVAILTLALGIGTTTAVFTIVNGVRRLRNLRGLAVYLNTMEER